MYDIYDGYSGKQHGDKNESKPAKKATINVGLAVSNKRFPPYQQTCLIFKFYHKQRGEHILNPQEKMTLLCHPKVGYEGHSSQPRVES